MKLFKIFLVLAVGAAVALAFAACKKKVEPTAATATALTAKTAEEVVCPKPGEDLICDECKTLFTTDEEYADHMEKTHPEKWAGIKDKFWELRGKKPGTAAPTAAPDKK